MYRVTRWRTAWAVLLVAVAAVAVAGCGSSSGGSSSASSSSGGSGGSTEGGESTPASFGTLSTSNCPSSATEAISGSTITLGTSAPLSGPFAEAGLGVKVNEAYVEALNEKGGIETAEGKKQLKLIALDDAYEPSRASANVRQLVQQDHVSAVVDMVGTPTASAAAPYLNAQCIPQMFSESGSSETLNEENPFSTQAITYVQEGNILAQEIKAKYANDKVAVLFQNDEVGQGILKGLTDAGIKITAKESYEPTDTTVNGQMTTLANTGAQVFINASFSTICAQAMNDANSDGWHPVIMMGTNCGSTDIENASPAAVSGGALQATYLKPPVGTEADQKEFAALSKAAGQPPTGIGQLAFTSMELAIQAIEGAKQLTPLAIAEAATELPSEPPAMFAPGVEIGQGVGEPAVSRFVVDSWDASKSAFVPSGATYEATDH